MLTLADFFIILSRMFCCFSFRVKTMVTWTINEKEIILNIEVMWTLSGRAGVVIGHD